MNDKFVDLHIHSCYSDGTMSPEEIANEAKRRGVGLISVCDHNVLEGSRELERLCKEAGLGFISGVEIDSLEDGTDYHILGYGADLYDTAFVSFIKRNRELLDDISNKLVGKMNADIQGISLSDYGSFSYDRRLGGWKCLHYLMSKDLADSLKDGVKYYAHYDCPFSIVDFPSVSDVCAEVRRAGGYAVLAHPGETMKHLDAEAFSSKLKLLVSMGFDGIECYYPSHSDEVTDECLKLCREHDLLVTAGSDCHGGFGKTNIGEVKATLEQLDLKGLI